MARFLHLEFTKFARRIGVVFLALSWCFGLFSGLLIFHNSGASIASLMGMAVSSHVSFFGTLIPFLLPFLLSAIAVYLSLYWLLPVICFCKACLFAYVSCGLIFSFGSAGWLVQVLFMLTDMCFSAALLIFWQRHISVRRGLSAREIILFLLVGIALAGADYLAVSPFLRGVLLI